MSKILASIFSILISVQGSPKNSYRYFCCCNFAIDHLKFSNAFLFNLLKLNSFWIQNNWNGTKKTQKYFSEVYLSLQTKFLRISKPNIERQIVITLSVDLRRGFASIRSQSLPLLFRYAECKALIIYGHL